MSLVWFPEMLDEMEPVSFSSAMGYGFYLERASAKQWALTITADIEGDGMEAYAKMFSTCKAAKQAAEAWLTTDLM